MRLLHSAASIVLLSLLTAEVRAFVPIYIGVLYSSGNPEIVPRYLESTLNATLGNRSLLPDYEVIVDVLRYEPGLAGVRLIEAMNSIDRQYAAIVGPTDNSDVDDSVRLSPAARIIQVHESTAPHLSNRIDYPYNFRGWRSEEGQMAIWFNMISLNAWDYALGLWITGGEVVSSSSFAEMYNISYVADIADTQSSPTFGDEWMVRGVQALTRNRMRVVMLSMGRGSGRKFVCYVHTAHLAGIQYFVPGYYSPGWWNAPACSADESYDAVRGHIGAMHTPFAPGINLFGELEVLPIDGDNSTEPLTCSPQRTVGDFFGDGELLMQGVAAGIIDSVADATSFFGFAGVRYEQLCAVLVGLHRTLYGRSVSLQRVLDRTPDAFQIFADEMELIDFQGPLGPFRYYPGTGDPVYVMFLVAQAALPWKSNSTVQLNGYVTFPNGPLAEPKYIWIEGQELVWRDGSVGLQPKPALARYPKCSELNAELWDDTCRPCRAGRYFDAYVEECRTCPFGSFASLAGQSACDEASLGHYIYNTSEPDTETPCPLGSACPEAGMTAPVWCAAGTFAGDFGSSACSVCQPGSFQTFPRASACNLCDEEQLVGGTTSSSQAISPYDCICPAGSYRPLDSRVCKPCEIAMVCPLGSDMANMNLFLNGERDVAIPVAEYGHMTLASEAYSFRVYKCEASAQCPGGPPGTCAIHRDSEAIACGQCAEGSYQEASKCVPCERDSAWPWIVAVIAGCLVIICATILSNREVEKTPATSLMIVIVAGLLFSSVQALGIFNQVEIPWVEPMTSILQLVSLFSFDLKLLKAQCVVGVNHTTSFALRQLVALVMIPVTWVTLLLKAFSGRFWQHGGQTHPTRVWVEFTNSAGTFFSIFFISILISAMDPFVCYSHPGGSHESVRSAPSLLCFEGGEHTWMVVIGLLALCVIPVPYFGLCCYGILRYPHAISMRDSSTFLATFRFLFFRYRPACYYFQVILLLRSFLLCAVPVAFRGNSPLQLICLAIILAAYVLTLEEVRPWRAALCNSVDALVTLMLVLLLLCGGLYIEDTPGKTAIAVLSVMLLVVIACAFILTACLGVKRRFMPEPWYHFFICHHKAHAAAQARYTKTTLLLKRSSLQIFIDSDNLQELDMLFEVVKAQVGCLLVYLTSDTLKRPWCAGEIVNACRVKAGLIKVITPSFQPIPSRQLQAMEAYLDASSCNLSEYNIQLSDVAVAYQQMLAPETQSVGLSSTHLGSRKFDVAASEILSLRGQTNRFRPTIATDRLQPLHQVPIGGVLISTDHHSDEANAAGAMLSAAVIQETIRACGSGVTLIADHPEDVIAMLEVLKQARAVLVVLSAGSLTSPSQLLLMCEAVRMCELLLRAPGITPVSVDGFEFPDAAYFQSTLPAFHAGFREVTSGLDEKAEAYLRSFFKRITVTWPTHGSQMALSAQAEIIFRRLYPYLRTSMNVPKFDGRRLSSEDPSHHSSGGLAGMIAGAQIDASGSHRGIAPQQSTPRTTLGGTGSQSSKDARSPSNSPLARKLSAGSMLRNALQAERKGNTKQGQGPSLETPVRRNSRTSSLRPSGNGIAASRSDRSRSSVEEEGDITWQECV